jgi:hypothetical protein
MEWRGGGVWCWSSRVRGEGGVSLDLTVHSSKIVVAVLQSPLQNGIEGASGAIATVLIGCVISPV